MNEELSKAFCLSLQRDIPIPKLQVSTSLGTRPFMIIYLVPRPYLIIWFGSQAKSVLGQLFIFKNAFSITGTYKQGANMISMIYTNVSVQ